MRLKANIGDFFGWENLGDKSVGIEIEMEAETMFPPPPETNYYWKREHDGSLRGEYTTEYVLKKPMTPKGAGRALTKLSEKIKENGTEVKDSVRAGTHVHINVRDLSFLEMWSMVTCWYVMERLLTYTLCGEGRVGNHFCLGADDADAVLWEIRGVLKGNRFERLGRDNIRYSALNLAALAKYGSLEFRGMRTPQDFEDIKLWVSVLLALKENSKLFPSPRHVVENFSHGGERNYLKAILGNDLAALVIGRDPKGWRVKLKKGVRIAQEVAYARDDWEKDEVILDPTMTMPTSINEAVQFDNWKVFAQQFEMEIKNNE